MSTRSLVRHSAVEPLPPDQRLACGYSTGGGMHQQRLTIPGRFPACLRFDQRRCERPTRHGTTSNAVVDNQHDSAPDSPGVDNQHGILPQRSAPVLTSNTVWNTCMPVLTTGTDAIQPVPVLRPTTYRANMHLCALEFV